MKNVKILRALIGLCTLCVTVGVVCGVRAIEYISRAQ